MYNLKTKREYEIRRDILYDHKIASALNLFWTGFILYTLAYNLYINHTINSVKLLNQIQYLGFFLIIVSSFFLVKIHLDNSYLSFIFYIFCLWNCLIITRGFQTTTDFFQYSIWEAYLGILPFMAPVILLFKIDLIYFKKLFNVINILGVFFLILCVWHWRQLMAQDEDELYRYLTEYLVRDLCVPLGFLLITFNYHTFQRRFFVLATIILALFFSIIRARRGLIFLQVSYLMSFFGIYIYSRKRKFLKLFFYLMFLAIFCLGGIYVYRSFKGSTFKFLAERIDEDTRTGVEVCFYQDFSLKDWLIGRGIRGEYYCPGIDNAIFNDYRNTIETGYLNIILRGGIISLGLMLLIFIPALIKGLFYSQNLLSKAAGLWILLWIFDLYPTVVDTFTLHYLLVWISVGICYSREIRNMTDDEITKLLTYKSGKSQPSV